MKAMRYFLSLCAIFCFALSARAQTTLTAGDVAIVGYNSDDPTNDDFSFILLKDITAGTTINFTDFGWCSGAGFTGFQSANPAPCGAGSFGSYSDGAITWTATSALTCGTQVRVQCRNSLSASTGTVTGLQATFNVATDYMSLAIGGDQIFAFQGSMSSPTFITGISMNGAWDATLAQCTFTSGQSTLPAALSASTSVEIIPEVDNAIYNCLVTMNSPANLRAAIFNVSNWNVNDAATFTLPISCTFGCNSNLAPTFTGGSPQSLTVCQNDAATSINSLLQVNDGNSGQTLTWTISSAPTHGTLGGFNYSITSNSGNLTPTGLTYTPTNGYNGPDAFTIQISDGIATNTTTINVTANSAPSLFTVIGGGSYCAGGSGVAVGLSNSTMGVNYQLQVGGVNSGSPVAGSTGLGINFGAKTTAGNYTVVATNATTNCSINMSGSVNIAVNPLPTITLGTNPSVSGGTTTASLPYTATTGSPTTYTITYDATALGAGFVNVGSTALPSSPISLTVPGSAALATYNGNIRVISGSCQGALTPFTVTLTNATPTFTGGSPQTLSVCQNAAATSINSLLAVSDVNNGQTLTWSVTSAASHGTVAASFSTTSTGGTVTPTGLTYTPTVGYFGPDAFTIQVSDGITTASTTISITVNQLPTVNIVTNQTVCAGLSTTAIALSGALSSTTFNWTNDNTAIGLAANGNGDIASFTTTNGGTSAMTGTIVVTPVKSGCAGTTTSFTITVNPAPTVNTVSNQSLCTNAPTAPVTFAGALNSTTFNWTNDQASIGLAGSGTGDIASFTAINIGTAPVVSTIVVTPVKSGCSGTPKNFAITVNPTPTVNTISNQTVCNNTTTTAISFSGAVSGTTFNWVNNNTSIGLAASGSGDITSFTATNSGTTALSATITVTPVRAGCTGTATNFTITVDPSPTVNAVSNQALCNGASTTAVAFSGALSSTTFNWTNNQTSVGLAASGIGDIASFTAANSGTAPVVATITVTPVKSGCTGTAGNFTITVNPTPTVNAVSNQTVCNNASTTAVSFGGAVSGTIFNWANDNSTIGLAASGSGDISSFTATNTGTTPVVATITVTPVRAGCTGTPISVTITVNPSPTVNTVSNQVVCNGSSTTAMALSGGVSNTTFNWTNNQTSIGLVASGVGDIASFTATNSSTTPVVATITVTPVKSGCTGTSGSFTITVDPTATVNTVSNQTVCNGASTTAVAFGGALSGTTFNWTNNTPSIGLVASGSGDITSFTATNSGTTPVIATITVTPVKAGCTGTAKSFTITVNPTATVNPISNQAVCNSAPTAIVTFSGAVSSTTFNWTNDQTSVGLVASGTGDIASFTATNSGTVPVVATITVTPMKSGCTGTPGSFTITVNPTPTVNTISNQTVCNAASTTAVAFGGAVSGTTFNWTNTTTSIGLAASGSGDILSFTTTNSGTVPVTATIIVTPVRAGCTGTPGTFTVTVNPTPTVNTVSNQSVCNGSPTAAVAFSGALGSTTFNWTNDQTSIGLTANGSGDIASFTAANAGTAPVVATIIVIPVKSGCAGVPRNLTITVNPIPTVSTVSNQTVCNGSSTTTVAFGGVVSGTTFNWTNNQASIGLAANGSGDISSFTAANSGTSPVTATITVTPVRAGCTGTSTSFAITVNPAPTVNVVANQAVCNGAPTTAVNFSGAVNGTTFSWTNSTTSIGLSANGTGNIASFNAVNATSAPVTATITVTPSANTCTGTASTFTITANPTPSVNTVSNQTVCNGASTTTINFSGSPVSGTSYNWTNSLTSIGLAASGTGNIASFTATNTGTAPVVATITVTPIANGCAGTPKVVTITVNPTPTANAVSNQTVCNGASTTAVNFGGSVSGSTFNWTNNSTLIGLPASGNGNIAPFNAINNSNAPVTATITVTPTANACVGVIRTFTITVNPTPTVNTVSNQTLCNGASTATVSFNSSVAGTSYSWTNNASSIGLASSGVGDISSFVAANASNAPTTATVTVTPSANGCIGTTGLFTITVNPTPAMAAVTNQTLCGGSNTTAISFTGPVSGSTFNWTNSNTSIGLAASGTGNIPSFTSINSGAVPQVAVVTVGPSANGCIGTASTFIITVNPIPVLASTQTPPAICNNTQFNYAPGSATPGTSFGWSRAAVPGISNAASSGFGSISEQLVNTTPNPIVVTYLFVLTANSCTNTQNVTVTVNPTPKLTSQLNHVICGDNPFVYTPISLTSGTAYMWSRASVAGITPVTGNGTGGINEILTNVTSSALTVTYAYVLAANGCTNNENVTLTVNPRPHIPVITIKSPDVLCSKTMFQNFGAASAAPQGATYNWTATNAEVWAQSSTKQQALISFPYPGTSHVVLTTMIIGTGCDSSATYTVEVGTQVAQQPEIIYHNGRFVCLQHDMDSYRWGYDDKITLDSSIVANETNQDYLNVNPDLNKNYYWVITTKDGCLQKSYYNAPTTIGSTVVKVSELKMYPNPASETITVEFDVVTTDITEIAVFDMAGKLLKVLPAGNGKVQIDVSSFAQGFYSVSCVREGTKIATAKFIKE
ncbi:PKD-like domain-containing protein [Polluticoccus soli]|uniref:PKD-like domain-containing protein n=1 Tax=Polluticoccus soli TaxID=3034150 RepID=UPI0023E0E37A|nr:PKD-like domain-containing protein [Flavipsychrobacter sp. JY13-12]